MFETVFGGLIVGAIIAVSGSMAFVAYYHPKQYNWFMYALLVGFAFLFSMVYGFGLKEQADVDVVKGLSSISEDVKATVVSAITAKDKHDLLLGRMIEAFYFYAAFLWLLPSLGLTAAQRESRNNSGDVV